MILKNGSTGSNVKLLQEFLNIQADVSDIVNTYRILLRL